MWDVCSDQLAVDLVRNVADPVTAAKLLVDHALAAFSTDNLRRMVASSETSRSCWRTRATLSVLRATHASETGRLTEAEKIVYGDEAEDCRRRGARRRRLGQQQRARAPTPTPVSWESTAPFIPTVIDGPVEEEPGPTDSDSPEATPDGAIIDMDFRTRRARSQAHVSSRLFSTLALLPTR